MGRQAPFLRARRNCYCGKHQAICSGCCWMPRAGRAAHLLLLRLSVFTLLLQVLLSSLVGKLQPASTGLPLLYTMVGGWGGAGPPEIHIQRADSQRSALNLFTWHGRVPSNPAICACGVRWGIIITSRKANFLSCTSFCGACSEVVASEGERTVHHRALWKDYLETPRTGVNKSWRLGLPGLLLAYSN